MGLCGSIHWKSDSSRKNRASLAYAETDNIPNSIPCTPVKNNTTNLLLSTLSNCGSKEDAFYDSQTWLDSDCDDDFHSVRGDFTPSCGNTPIHSSRALSPQVNRALFEGRSSGSEGLSRSFRGGIDNQAEDDAATSLSEEKKKNKLGDLFDESARSDKDEVKNLVEAETPSPSKRTSSPCCFPSARGFKKALFSPPTPTPTPAPPISVDA